MCDHPLIVEDQPSSHDLEYLEDQINHYNDEFVCKIFCYFPYTGPASRRSAPVAERFGKFSDLRAEIFSYADGRLT